MRRHARAASSPLRRYAPLRQQLPTAMINAMRQRAALAPVFDNAHAYARRLLFFRRARSFAADRHVLSPPPCHRYFMASSVSRSHAFAMLPLHARYMPPPLLPTSNQLHCHTSLSRRQSAMQKTAAKRLQRS